jgi:ferritin-like metal-binding protein YciE
MPALRSPQDVLVTELKEIHSAERQLSRALPRLAKQASSERLREMLDQRREQGAVLIERIDDALEEMHTTKPRQKNLAAEGLIEDMQQHIEEVEEERLLDPLLLAGVQKIEHYCIAAWGTAKAMGRLLGEEQIVKTMEQVLEEGKEFDDQMTRLAEEEINPRMLGGEEAEEEEEGASGGRRGSRRRSR